MTAAFYPFKKGELVPRLKGISFAVAQALRLGGTPSSQTINDAKIRLSTRVPETPETPWLPRKVLLDSDGIPVAIGFPRLPRAQYESVARLMAADTVEQDGKARSPRPDTPCDYSVVRIFYATDRQKTIKGGYTGSRRPDGQLYGLSTTASSQSSSGRWIARLPAGRVATCHRWTPGVH